MVAEVAESSPFYCQDEVKNRGACGKNNLSLACPW